MLVSGGGDRPPAFDLNYLWGYQMVKPLSKLAQAEEPDEKTIAQIVANSRTLTSI